MPARKRKRRERTHDWQEIQQYTLWPEQQLYEKIRPVVLFGETAAERARETGTSERTLYHQAKLFEQEGMASLFHKPPTPSPDKGRALPPEMRQLIVDLKAEHPGFRPHEIATICFLRFERRPSDHTVKRVLADGGTPTVTGRRYPPYAQIADPYQRRRAIVDLHAEGWSNTAISAYLQTPRHRVYEVLKRWAKFGHRGLEDIPQWHARKAGTQEINEVGKLVIQSPELGAYRVRAALEQIGIHLSQATCGRLLALNRKLYGLSPPKGSAEHSRKEMPFKARFRFEYWSVDVRYIEEHGLGFPEPIYMISILENYTRAILASKLSLTQNQWDYLEVLFAALSRFGTPSAIVSDGGGIFSCNQAMDVYAALGIRKERIEPRQAWQNYVESHLYVIWNLSVRENCQITCILWTWDDPQEEQFHRINIARKMADAKFARATSWEEVLAIHRRFLHDYNVQRHWAHEKREDGCHSPAQVLGSHTGTIYPAEFLDRILFATRYTRHLDKHGFLRFQNWKQNARAGLGSAPVTVWVYEGSLKIEHQAVTLSKYTVELQDDHKHLQAVSNPRLSLTPFRSPQLALFDLGPHEWLLSWKTPDRAPAHRKRRIPGVVQQLPLFEIAWEEKAVGANETGLATLPRNRLHLVRRPSETEEQ